MNTEVLKYIILLTPAKRYFNQTSKLYFNKFRYNSYLISFIFLYLFAFILGKKGMTTLGCSEIWLKSPVFMRFLIMYRYDFVANLQENRQKTALRI
jgi:hypothetical protein